MLENTNKTKCDQQWRKLVQMQRGVRKQQDVVNAGKQPKQGVFTNFVQACVNERIYKRLHKIQFRPYS